MIHWPRPALAAACLVVLGAPTPAHAPARTNRDVILATTTSTQDTGLLDSLVPRFEHTCGCRVKTIAVGTGRALGLAARGEADVALVHAPALEERYVAQGKFVGRRLVMTNDFVVLGPKADPAGLRHARQVEDAFRALAEGKAPFASRADSSGTHLLELALWKQAGIEPKGPWYLEVGQGMGATLRIASQKEAYTLSDRGTFLAQRSTLDLDVVFQGAPDLLNIYHVMLPNPDSFPKVNIPGGRAFADFLIAPETQAFIGRFGTGRFGEPLFTPAANRREEDLRRRAA
ncbi:MAG TPA: substrate-binding domain-containing protein [Gemmatimonadales bacterium]|jgi:tungstate transport system substrate-binding protein